MNYLDLCLEVTIVNHCVFMSHYSTFLSVCGTWIYRLLYPAHAHLPCTTLLNFEECALSEKKKNTFDFEYLGNR